MGDVGPEVSEADGTPSFLPRDQFVDEPGVARVSRQLTSVAADTFVDDPDARFRVMLAVEELA